MITSAFTCTGPYAILILLGIKRVENRSVMPVPPKGRCAISCSKSFAKEEYGEFVRWASSSLSDGEFELIPAWDEVKDWPGKIIGACDYRARGRDDLVLECKVRTRGSASLPWDEGYDYWWDLSGVACFERPISCRGNVGMWQLPHALSAQVTAADRLSRAVGKRIATAEEAAELFRIATPIAGGSEGFFVLSLDEDRRVLSEPVLVSLGTSAVTTAVSPGEVFGAALALGAKSIIVAHNHPSGNVAVSPQDRELTAALKHLGVTLGISVLDHLIVTESAYVVA